MTPPFDKIAKSEYMCTCDNCTNIDHAVQDYDNRRLATQTPQGFFYRKKKRLYATIEKDILDDRYVACLP